MERERRVALLKLIKAARNEAQLREQFVTFTELSCSLPPRKRPTEEGVLDVLQAFGPSMELAFELSDYYYKRAWGGDRTAAAGGRD